MLTLKIYNILTILVTSYFLITLFLKENQIFIFSLYVIKSKFYFCLTLNLIIMISVNLIKIFIKIFFDDIRLSELIQVVEKIRMKIISFLLIFLTLRPTIDLSKIIMVVLYIFMSFLSNLACKRADYIITLLDGSKKTHFKILFLFIFFSYINNFVYTQIQNSFEITNAKAQYSTSTSSKSGMNQSLDSLIYYIFSCEFIFLIIKLVSKIIKFIIEITQIYMQKPWEKKLISFNIINFLKYSTKLFIEIKFCIKLVKAGVIPLFFMMDVFYSCWSLMKMCYKIYHSYKINNYINNLPDYNPIVKADEDNDQQNNKFEGDKNPLTATDTQVCIICLSEVENGKMLACGHAFHLHCIKEWIYSNSICPYCKETLSYNKEDNKKMSHNRLRHYEQEQINNSKDDTYKKQINDSTGLPFISSNKILTAYNSLKKIKEIQTLVTNTDTKMENTLSKSSNSNQHIGNSSNSINSQYQTNQTGAISFSLPMPALLSRNIENELLRLEFENFNNKISDLYENPYQILSHFDLNSS